MNKVTSWFVVGAVTIAAVYFFRFQQRFAGRIVEKAKTRDPEAIVVALAMTVGLGAIVVVVAQAARKL